MIVRRERLEDSHCCRQARGKSRRDCAAFDNGERMFKGRTIRIVGAGVAETCRIISVRRRVETSWRDESAQPRRRLRGRPCGRRAPRRSPAAIQDRAPPCLLAEVKPARTGCQSFSLSVCESFFSSSSFASLEKTKRSRGRGRLREQAQRQNRQSGNLPAPALSAICI